MRGIKWAESRSVILDAMLRSLHFISWITGNLRKAMVSAAEDDNLDRSRRAGERLLRSSRGWMNEQINEWSQRWMVPITSSGVSTCRRKGSGFHILFNCYPLPRPRHSWMVSLFGTHVYLFLKCWDLRATCIVLVIFKQSALGGQYPNQLNQNSQGSQAETRNKQSK